LGTLDTPVFASYGLDAQFARLQHALDDVADHLQGDAETLQLQADVSASKNGREPTTVILSSRLRSAR
jgi:hypothetical protein